MYKFSFNTPIKVHFIGIGGISMSSLAHILLHRGFKVSGSDREPSELTDMLTAEGADIYFPQSADNIKPDVDLTVYTAAIADDDPELAAAMAHGPVLTRAQFLGQIMACYADSITVSGTHGKTTTTSMLSHVLTEAGLDPTVTVGGILSSIGGNTRLGSDDLFLAEACEYKNSFHNFISRYAIILNVEADHLDFFKDIDDIRASFNKFASGVHEDGAIIIGGDIPELDSIVRGVKAPVITFGRDKNSDYYPSDISYDDRGCASFTVWHGDDDLGRISLKVPGEHNIHNALAATALSMRMGIPFDSIAAGLSTFTGTGRRFEYKGEVNGVTVIDDYAHHPTEIKATIAAARKYPHDRLIVAFQSHTYTRTAALLDDFAQALSGADIVLLADIYAAREENTIGITAAAIKDAMADREVVCEYLGSFEKIEQFILEKCHKNDLLITMGAGNIVDVAEHLVKH